MLTKSVLRQMWPRAPSKKIDAIIKVAPRTLDQYGIKTDLEIAHFMAQISHENGGGTISRENMNYSAGRMMQIFGVGRHSAKVTEEEAEALAHKPQQIAERVYGLGNPKKAKELGNTRPGDGYRFRGGGDLQLTGGANYKRIGELTGFDLYDNPELLDDPATSFKVSCAEFAKLNCLPPARKDDIFMVTKRVNGGTNGLAERTVWLRKWKAALAAEDDEYTAEVVEAPIPPPPEPRGGESDKEPSNTGITLLRTGAGGLGVTAAVAQGVSSVVGPVRDTIREVSTVTDGAGSIIETSQRVVSIAPDGFWLNALAFMQRPAVLGCIILGICAAWGVTWYLRRRQQGSEA